ncbi:Hypothetical_protein [Hexamita inflata]|uniref:Hypothetical_protein n=1 Tax=Hexamita inflata TaxID=28002 RepID=A0AA86Q9X1_9EUKA|nr:Hypothetical protein HINF_LOCUS42710 [Hexamita inflata]
MLAFESKLHFQDINIHFQDILARHINAQKMILLSKCCVEHQRHTVLNHSYNFISKLIYLCAHADNIQLCSLTKLMVNYVSMRKTSFFTQNLGRLNHFAYNQIISMYISDTSIINILSTFNGEIEGTGSALTILLLGCGDSQQQ